MRKIRKLFDEHGKDNYIGEHGFGVYDYVCGELKNGSTHAWLESKGLILNITLDQFGIHYPPVNAGIYHSFYEMFTDLEIQPYKTLINTFDVDQDFLSLKEIGLLVDFSNYCKIHNNKDHDERIRFPCTKVALLIEEV